MKNRYHIPTPLYKKILAVMPVLTVDIVIAHEGKFLLLKRAIAPAKGQWWTPGGRVLKGEKLEEAARRKAKEETGISVKVVKLVGADGVLWKRGAQGVSSHTPSVIYLAHPTSKRVAVKTNFNNQEGMWFSRIPKGLHPFVKNALKAAKFR